MEIKFFETFLTKHFRYLKWRYSPKKAVCKAYVRESSSPKQPAIRFVRKPSILGTERNSWWIPQLWKAFGSITPSSHIQQSSTRNCWKHLNAHDWTRRHRRNHPVAQVQHPAFRLIWCWCWTKDVTCWNYCWWFRNPANHLGCLKHCK